MNFTARQSCYSPPHVAVIDVHSFGFTYPGAQRPAVRDVAFSVEPGEVFGFLGPSGAGKSTTQNVPIRLLDGYEGSVAVLGRDLRAWDRGYYRRICVAFEAPNHYLRVVTAVGAEVMREVPGGVPVFEPFIRYHTFGESSVDFTVILRAKEFVDQYLINTSS